MPFTCTMFVLRMWYILPYTYLLWLGKPYRRYYDKYEYNRNIHNKFEHYLGRFATVVALFTLSVMCLTIISLVPGGFIATAVISIIFLACFDMMIYGCRALFVMEAVKRTPEGGNQLAVWNDKSLWEDD